MIEWSVSPEIISRGGFVLRWYSVCFAIPFILSFFILRSIFKNEGKTDRDLDDLFLYIFVGIVVGARLGHILFYDPGYYFSHPLEIFQIWRGGLASHGASIGMLIALYLFSRKRPAMPMMWVIDRLSITVPFGAVFVRIGNLFNSEIYGKPTDAPWAFIFTRIDSIPRHPTQLYEAISYLIILGVLMLLYRVESVRSRGGLLAGLAFASVFFMRFIIEFFKENQAAFNLALPLNMGQLLSLPFIVLGLILIINALVREPSNKSA